MTSTLRNLTQSGLAQHVERGYQVVVPQRRFAGSVVTGEDDRERFVAGNRLEHFSGVRWPGWRCRPHIDFEREGLNLP
jgi:hypothetical protein